MPKGDREILKADTEDRHTPVANLLLEALAVAKLTGREKGIISLLIRKTYGWQQGNGRLKDTTLPIEHCAKVCSTDKRTAQRLLAGLVKKKVLLRKFSQPGNGYTYQLNTRVGEWSNGCLNHQLLEEIARVGLVKNTTLRLAKIPTPRVANLATPKEILKKDIKKDDPDIEIKDKEQLLIDRTGQSLEKIRRILKGGPEARGVPERIKKHYRWELKQLGLSEQC